MRLDTLGLGISGVTETDSVPERSSDPNDKHIRMLVRKAKCNNALEFWFYSKNVTQSKVPNFSTTTSMLHGYRTWPTRTVQN